MVVGQVSSFRPRSGSHRWGMGWVGGSGCVRDQWCVRPIPAWSCQRLSVSKVRSRRGLVTEACRTGSGHGPSFSLAGGSLFEVTWMVGLRHQLQPANHDAQPSYAFRAILDREGVWPCSTHACRSLSHHVMTLLLPDIGVQGRSAYGRTPSALEPSGEDVGGEAGCGVLHFAGEVCALCCAIGVGWRKGVGVRGLGCMLVS